MINGLEVGEVEVVVVVEPKPIVRPSEAVVARMFTVTLDVLELLTGSVGWTPPPPPVLLIRGLDSAAEEEKLEEV